MIGGIVPKHGAVKRNSGPGAGSARGKCDAGCNGESGGERPGPGCVVSRLGPAASAGAGAGGMGAQRERRIGGGDACGPRGAGPGNDRRIAPRAAGGEDTGCKLGSGGGVRGRRFQGAVVEVELIGGERRQPVGELRLDGVDMGDNELIAEVV